MELHEIQREIVIKKRRRNSIFIILLILFALPIAIFNILDTRATVSLKDLELKKVNYGTFEVKLIGNGQFQPRTPKLIASEQSGVVRELYVELGDQVEKGEKIARLENETLSLKKESVRSKIKNLELTFELKKAKLELDKSRQETELERLKGELYVVKTQFLAQEKLAAKGLISELDIMQTKAQLKNMERQVEFAGKTLRVLSNLIEKELMLVELQISEARMDLRTVEKNFTQLTILAPSSGLIQSFHLKSGEQVTSGKIVAEISTLDNLHFVAQIPEREAQQISNSNYARIRVSDSWLDGVIERVSPNVENGFVDVFISFDKMKMQDLKQGLSAKVEIVTEVFPGSLYIDKRRGYKPHSDNYLWLLNDQQDRLVRKEVRLGQFSANKARVLAGLKKGQKVVTSESALEWGITPPELEL